MKGICHVRLHLAWTPSPRLELLSGQRSQLLLQLTLADPYGVRLVLRGRAELLQVGFRVAELRHQVAVHLAQAAQLRTTQR